MSPILVWAWELYGLARCVLNSRVMITPNYPSYSDPESELGPCEYRIKVVKSQRGTAVL